MTDTFFDFAHKAKPFAERINEKGGQLYLVGGCVRDYKLGILSPKDYDFLVTGLTKDSFETIFPNAPFVGNEEDGFPVFLVDIEGEKCEFAFARKEKKVSSGYKGFETYTDPSLTVEDDLIRRDLTINAMAYDLLSGEFIDPYKGISDLEEGIIRHVSPAFAEDPLRVLRAARFAARYGFTIDKETLEFMRTLKEELQTFTPERVFEETKKALSGKKPSVYFKTLAEIGVLSIHYKEIANLMGVPQPKKFHPEGDCFEHSMLVLDEMAKLTDKLEYRFAALVHDLGKADSPEKWLENPEKYPYETHHGHEVLGVPHVKSLVKRLKLPNTWLKAGVFGAEFHGKMHKLGSIKATKSIKKIIRMMEEAKRNPLGVEGIAFLALSDSRGKGNPEENHPYIDFWMKASKAVLAVKADATLPIQEIAEEKRNRQAVIYKKIKKEMNI